jgi:hypothetical protein
MNTVPIDLLFGVDVAIKKLRPGANFQLEGSRITIWNDPEGRPAPTWDEVQAQLDSDKNLYNQHLGIKEDEYPIFDSPAITGEPQGGEFEETPVSKQRMTVCKQCDSYMLGIRVCKECSCFMPIKTLLTDAVCPLGKW